MTVFYPRLAFDGIRKNKKMYIPYILTCILSSAMYYILKYLCYSKTIKQIPKTETVISVIAFGCLVIAIFSAIFLFYTNSFLIKSRKKEFGLYNILGMDKTKVGRVLFFETLFVAVISILSGILFGIIFSKLCELILLNLIETDISFNLTVSSKAIFNTATVFTAIFLALYIYSYIGIRISKPLELVKSESFGEKPPRANFVFGILGFVLLGVAYYIAITIKNPIEALTWFFVAVVLVILGTYLVFVAGSVMLCKILQKNKKYYYKKNHFVSVSSMTYRMKRNGAGLASICVLLTMVLVMISSTSCLFFGREDGLRSRYPRDIAVKVNFEKPVLLSDSAVEKLETEVKKVCKENNIDIKKAWNYRDSSVTGLLTEDGKIDIDSSHASVKDFNKLITVHIMPLSDYQKMTGDNTTLREGEAIAYATLKTKLPNKITVGNKTVKIVKRLKNLDVEGSSTTEVVANCFIIVPNVNYLVENISSLLDPLGEIMVVNSWCYGFDTTANEKMQIKATGEIGDVMLDATSELNAFSYSIDCLSSERNDFAGTFGGFFFLGIMLSVLFLVVAVIIIYYKQISEGFEDASRFDIMQKVGMTKKDIKKSINSQMLTVFFLPIIFAVVHLAFAFPLIRKLLLLFGLNNLSLFIFTTCLSALVFTLFYLAVYKLTSNLYFSIVSNNKYPLD